MHDPAATARSAESSGVPAEDYFELRSVGVDIGSATTQIVFSRLTLARLGTRYVVVSREIIHESPVMLTPYLDTTAIDDQAMDRFFQAQFAAAGLSREDVDAGALILTGLALLRPNARRVAELFSTEAGRFVAVSAGDHLESVMSAYGSGVVEHSRLHDGTYLNVDIGGGTTKVAVCHQGVIQQTTALDVGARLVVVDEQNVVRRAEDRGRSIATSLGIDVAEGHVIKEDDRHRLAAYLVDGLFEVLKGQRTSPLLRGEPLAIASPPDGIGISGGVSEYVYGRETQEFGDLGPLLALKVRDRLSRQRTALLDGESGGIRSTVVGASQYTVQVSGNTIYVSATDLLPVRNVPVVVPSLSLSDKVIDAGDVAARTRQALRLRDDDGAGPLAVRVDWDGQASYGRLVAVARGLADALSPCSRTLVLLLDDDIGRALGRRLHEIMPGASVIAVDCVSVGPLDHVDIGEFVAGTGSVPVTIKSLVFT